MKIKDVFQNFYGVTLEIGPRNSIETHGLERLPEDTRTSLEKWLDENTDLVLYRLKNGK